MSETCLDLASWRGGERGVEGGRGRVLGQCGEKWQVWLKASTCESPSQAGRAHSVFCFFFELSCISCRLVSLTQDARSSFCQQYSITSTLPTASSFIVCTSPRRQAYLGVYSLVKCSYVDVYPLIVCYLGDRLMCTIISQLQDGLPRYTGPNVQCHLN